MCVRAAFMYYFTGVASRILKDPDVQNPARRGAPEVDFFELLESSYCTPLIQYMAPPAVVFLNPEKLLIGPLPFFQPSTPLFSATPPPTPVLSFFNISILGPGCDVDPRLSQRRFLWTWIPCPNIEIWNRLNISMLEPASPIYASRQFPTESRCK